MTAVLERCFLHNRWANRRMLEACRDLTPGELATSVPGTFGELGRTLVHLVRAETWYVHLLTGWDPGPSWSLDDPFPGVEALLERCAETGGRLVDVAGETEDGRLVRIPEDDGHVEVPAWVILLQAIDHAHEHRGQVATILTQLGRRPPAVDGWAFGEDAPDPGASASG